MRRWIMVLFMVLVGCRGGQTAAAAAGETSGEEGNRGKYYEAAAVPNEVGLNEKVSVVVSFTAGSGYHWNDEYPARFEVSGGEGVGIEKREFSVKTKDVEVSKDAARITIPVVVKESGAQDLLVKGSFSVCNETSCKIMRNEEIHLPLTGR
ncbi:MAG: hypothetical protein FJ109_10890 [Deltaproteobacteria bacterium]|nr:hypothetical protein [Deltaproteobacteria bacterium]